MGLNDVFQTKKEIMIYRLLVFILAGLSLLATTVAAKSLPAPVQALADRGIKIVQKFDAPGEVTGYAAQVGPRWLAIYVMPDGKHAIVGTLLDAQGNALTQQVLDQIKREHVTDKGPIWPRLADSYWVADGSKNAERVVYVFTDPNCPFCHMFWKRSRPWVKSGEVQLRHIMVGIIKQSSPGKAATIMTAENSEKVLTRNQRNYKQGGVEPMDSVPDSIRRKLQANLMLMKQLGIYGTPGIVYRDEQGQVHIVQGVPARQKMDDILGERE